MPGYGDYGQNDRWEPHDKGYRVVMHADREPREVVVMPKQLTVSNRLTAVLLILFILAAAALAFQASNRMFLEKEHVLLQHDETLLCEVIHSQHLVDHNRVCKP